MWPSEIDGSAISLVFRVVLLWGRQDKLGELVCLKSRFCARKLLGTILGRNTRPLGLLVNV